MVDADGKHGLAWIDWLEMARAKSLESILNAYSQGCSVTQKAHEHQFVGFLVFVVGRAGFEPATNGLKVRGAIGWKPAWILGLSEKCGEYFPLFSISFSPGRSVSCHEYSPHFPLFFRHKVLPRCKKLARKTNLQPILVKSIMKGNTPLKIANLYHRLFLFYTLR